jgi:hypothetical protein
MNIHATLNGCEIDLRVIPGAAKDAIAGDYDGALKVRVSAPPERGKANKAVIKLLARALGVPERDVTITSGETSQNKTVEIAGLTMDELADRIAKAMR